MTETAREGRARDVAHGRVLATKVLGLIPTSTRYQTQEEVKRVRTSLTC
jgi:hypothetical protein